jgi:hypothetical protein
MSKAEFRGCNQIVVQNPLTVGVRLARMQFPHMEGKIEDLLRREENFRDMCEELADLDCAILGGRVTVTCSPTGSQHAIS